MDAVLADLLTCPYCRGRFSPRYQSGAEPWIMTCHCSRFPVVAGTPVIKIDRETSKVVDLIERGQHFDAFVAVMMPPSGPASPRQSSVVQRVFNLLRHRRLRRNDRRWHKHSREFLATVPGRHSAFDMLDFYYRQPPAARPTAFGHFAFRFGQPRHLVALSFATLIKQPVKPSIEIACGFGHITRSLVARAGVQPVIGVDRNFFMLYVARTWVAPEAQYVCMDTELGLPFDDGTFEAAFCVDGWQYFAAKLATIRELRRVVRKEGPVFMVGSRNARHTSGDRRPLTPEGYQGLVANLPHRIVADDAVLGSYLARKGPPLATSSTLERMRVAATLSIVVSENEEIWKDHGEFADWPHAEGSLGLNPLYRSVGGEQTGAVRLRRVFPSLHYEEENSECKLYLPDEVTVENRVLADVERGTRTPDVERLIERCLVLGMPSGYGLSAMNVRRDQ